MKNASWVFNNRRSFEASLKSGINRNMKSSKTKSIDTDEGENIEESIQWKLLVPDMNSQ